MKFLTKQLSSFVMLCILLFCGFSNAKAASSSRPANSEDSSKKIKVSSKSVKSRSINKLLNKTKPKEPICSLPAAGKVGFTNCLAKYVNAETLAGCAYACGGVDYGTCAACVLV